MPDVKTISKLSRVQHDAKAELITRIKKAQVRLARKIRGLKPDKFPIWDKAVRETFFNQVGSHYELIGKELDVWGKELVGKVGADFHKTAITDIKALTGPVVSGKTLRFSRERVNRYWEIIHPDNAKHLAAVFTDKMAATDIQALRAAFLDTYRQRALESWTQAEYHKRLFNAWEDVADNLNANRFVDAAGRPWNNDRYLNMLVRTTTARVARDSYFDTLIQNGDDLARIGPSGDSCPICRAWIGIIISISGSNPKFPSYQQALNAGMFHPNCDCLCSRIDPTVHADDIARQEKTKNVDWNDREAVEGYKEDFMKDPSKPAAATLKDVKSLSDGKAAKAAAAKAAAKSAAEAKAIKAAQAKAQAEALAAQKAAEAAAKKKAAAEAARQAEVQRAAREAAEKARIDAILDADDLDSLGAAGADDFGKLLKRSNRTVGGTQGSIVTVDRRGKEWVTKDYKGNEDRVRNEWAANRLYDMLGIKVPRGRLARFEGKLVYCSELNPDVVVMGSKYVDFAADTLTLRRGFVADSWLANWDVAGENFDNVMLIPGQKASILRIDHGGSLTYRAMGEKKTAKDWGAVVQELDSLRSGMNPQTARLFARVTEDDIQKAVLQLRKLAPEKQIRAILQASGWTEETIAELERTLIARKKFLTQRYLGTKAKKAAAQVQVAEAAEASTSEAVTANEVALIKDARQNGVAIRIDVDDIEDQNVLFWMEIDSANRPVMGAVFKAHGKALQKIDDLAAKVTNETPIFDAQGIQDDIESALKGLGRVQLDGAAGKGDGLIRAKDVERVAAIKTKIADLEVKLLDLEAEGKIVAKSAAAFDKAFRPWLEALEKTVKPGAGKKVALKTPPGQKLFAKESWTGPKFVKQKKKAGDLNFTRQQLYERKETVNGFPRVVGKGGMGEFDVSFPYYEATTEEGTIVRLWPSSGAYTQRGRIEIISQGQDAASAERIRKTIGNLGIRSTRATPADMEELYLRQIAHNATRTLADFQRFEATVQQAGTTQAAKIEASKTWLNDYLKTDITKSPIYNPQGKRQAFGHGWNIRERPELVGPEWDDFAKKYRFYHDLEYGKPYGTQVQTLDDILNTGGQMIATADKLRRGFHPRGASPESDMRSGGSVWIYGRIRSLRNAKGSRGLTWKATHFRRTDALRYPTDHYGRTKEGQAYIFRERIPQLSDWKTAAGSGGNETNLKHSISIFDDLDFFGVKDQDEKVRALAVFEKHGWKATDPWPDGSGRTVEDIIRIVGK